MAKYHRRHICVLCGNKYEAFSSNSTHCPNCIHEAPHVCLHCGVEFNARSMNSHYCDKHRYMQSPAYLAKVEQSKKEAAERRKERNRRYREKQAAKVPGKRGRPRTRPEKPEKKKVITSTPILESRPVEIIVAKLPAKPVEKFFLTIGKTRYGFINEERLNEFKKRKGIA